MCLWRFQKDSVVKQLLRFNGSLGDASLVLNLDPVDICKYLYTVIRAVSPKLYDKCVKKIFNIDDQYIYSVVFQNMERLADEGVEFRDISNPEGKTVDTGVVRYVGSMYVTYKYTYRELAERLNVSRNTIFQYIQRLSKIDPDLYERCQDVIKEHIIDAQVKLSKKSR